MHSGLQFGGVPRYVGKQEHDGIPPISRHSANAPQGDGIHGSFTVTSSTGSLTVIMVISILTDTEETWDLINYIQTAIRSTSK